MISDALHESVGEDMSGGRRGKALPQRGTGKTPGRLFGGLSAQCNIVRCEQGRKRLACEKREFAFALGSQRIEADQDVIDESRMAHHKPALRQPIEKLPHQRTEIGLFGKIIGARESGIKCDTGARGAFSKADAAAAGATLAAYAIGLIPFVLIRSAVATFYARKDTATPVKASLTGLTVNVLLKVLLMGSLAQIGLALATAVGAWINLLLVLGFAVRAGYLDIDKALMQSLAKFVVCGAVVSAALWLAAKYAAIEFAQMHTLRDETTLVLLIAVGAFVYGFAILLLFGRGWIFSLVRDR